MKDKTVLTPLMQQYFDLRQRYRGVIIFFRLGDFYEMFDEDAKWASKALGLTLTSRHGYAMCGVPSHASENYLEALLALGKKVAICEQVSTPEKGIAEREVVEIMTPASVLGNSILKNSASKYLVAIALRNRQLSFSYIEISTGEFFAFSSHQPWQEWLSDCLDSLEPKEILVQESLLDPTLEALFISKQILVSQYPDWFFDEEHAYKDLLHRFGTTSLKGFGFEKGDPALATAGALLSYLEENTRHNLPHVQSLKKKKLQAGMTIDEESRRNLEIFYTQHGGTETSLYHLLNETLTASGARLLRTWLQEPLSDIDQINQRLSLVDEFYQMPDLMNMMRQHLAKIQDIARLSGRLAMDKAHAKDLIAIRVSLQQVFACHQLLPIALPLDEQEKEVLGTIERSISQTLLDNPNVTLHEGGLIRSGYDSDLDYYHKLTHSGLEMLEAYAKEERQATGINLRLKENRVVGYFFEVNKNQASQLPDRFIRRQSMVTGERFTTEKMMSLQSDIANAKEKVVEMERQIFLSLVQNIKTMIGVLFTVAERIAICDITSNFAYLAHKYSYCRPHLVLEKKIYLKAARHPIVECVVPKGEFISNDLSMKQDDSCFLITGPNMAGKSTYLRQNALIILMAYIGCYVPADEAQIGVVDRIFCRIGANDNLAKGESTFLLEMNETARILRYATPQSLVIMDEVGRGTGSDDGLALARAILEDLSENLSPYLLFATHYHELTRLQGQHFKNYSLAVKEENDQIYFLKQVRPGPATGSYGIHVARLAGVPERVLHRAEIYLQELLQKKTDPLAQQELSFVQDKPVHHIPSEEEVLAQALWTTLQQYSLDNISPLEALNLLYEWKERFKSTKKMNSTGRKKLN